MNAIEKGWMRSMLSNILDDDDIEGESIIDNFSQCHASAYVMSPLTMELESKREKITTTSTSNKPSMLTQRVQITEILSTSCLNIIVSDCQCTIPAYISKRAWAKLVSNRGSTTLSAVLGAVIKLTSYRFVPTDVVEFAMLGDCKKMQSQQNSIPMRPMLCLLIDEFELMGSQGSAQFGTNPLPFPCDAREKKLLSNAVQNKTLMKKLVAIYEEEVRDGFSFPSFQNGQVPDAFEASDLKQAIVSAGPQWIPSSSTNIAVASTKISDDAYLDVDEEYTKEEDDDDFEICSVSSHEEVEETKEKEEGEEEETKRKRKDISSGNSPETKKKRRLESPRHRRENDIDDDDEWLIYVTERENETLKQISQTENAPSLKTLLLNNRQHYPGLSARSRFKKGSWIYLEKKPSVVTRPDSPSSPESPSSPDSLSSPDSSPKRDVTVESKDKTTSKFETLLLPRVAEILECFANVRRNMPLKASSSLPQSSLENRISIVKEYYSSL